MTYPDADIPRGKQTVLGLYRTARQACEKWKAAPDKVKILDVRTLEESLFPPFRAGLDHPRRAADRRAGRGQRTISLGDPGNPRIGRGPMETRAKP